MLKMQIDCMKTEGKQERNCDFSSDNHVWTWFYEFFGSHLYYDSLIEILLISF